MINAERLFVTLAFVLLILLVCLVSSCSSTPKIRNGISEIRNIVISSIKQTIVIRGNNVNNPILLYLHGGPGSTELIPFRLAHKNLEEYFTIVLWEQRGTGKSFSGNISKESMTIEQFISDTHELTTYLLKEFNHRKIVLVGHSWGSALGLLTVAKYPELYYAYVGSGQEIEPEKGERIGYEYVLEKAKENKKALDQLQKLDQGNPYLTIDKEGKWFSKIKTQRKWLVSFGGELHQRNNYSLLFNAKSLFAPEYTFIDFIKFERGSVFSLKTMWPQIMKINFNTQIPKVSIPVFFLQGKHDFNTPTHLVEQYFLQVEAPKKELIFFENSGHHPMYEEPEKYEKVLIENVLPLCTGEKK